MIRSLKKRFQAAALGFVTLTSGCQSMKATGEHNFPLVVDPQHAPSHGEPYNPDWQARCPDDYGNATARPCDPPGRPGAIVEVRSGAHSKGPQYDGGRLKLSF